jgi:hypothetical protein
MKAMLKPLNVKEFQCLGPFCIDVLGRAVQKECRKTVA